MDKSAIDKRNLRIPTNVIIIRPLTGTIDKPSMNVNSINSPPPILLEPAYSHIAMIKSYLEDDHKIALTHGDLHPRNIMVQTYLHNSPEDSAAPKEPHNTNSIGSQSSTRIIITGMLDREMCGWYPEYWQSAKALSTITRGSDMDDWWVYLPRAIRVPSKEHAVMLNIWHG